MTLSSSNATFIQAKLKALLRDPYMTVAITVTRHATSSYDPDTGVTTDASSSVSTRGHLKIVSESEAGKSDMIQVGDVKIYFDPDSLSALDVRDKLIISGVTYKIIDVKYVGENIGYVQCIARKQ